MTFIIKDVELKEEGLRNSNFILPVLGEKEGKLVQTNTFEIKLYKKQFGYAQEGVTCHHLIRVIEKVLKEKLEIYQDENFKKALEHLDLTNHYIYKAGNKIIEEIDKSTQTIF